MSDAISRRELFDRAARGMARTAGRLAGAGLDEHLRPWRRQVALAQIPTLSDDALQRLMASDGAGADLDVYLAAARENLRRLERRWGPGRGDSAPTG